MKQNHTGILYIGLIAAMMGYGIAMPVLPFYITGMGGTGIHYGLLIACYGIMQLLFAPVWGSLSDAWGRKPVLLLGMAGLSAAMVLLALSTELWMLYAAQLLSGTLSSAMLPASQAYISDSTSSSERAGAMGKIGGSVGIGIILGPGIGGLLASEHLSTPFFAASIFCALTCVLIFILLPESLKPEDRHAPESLRILQLQGLKSMLFSAAGYGLAAVFLAILAQTMFSSIYGLYVMQRFGYGPEQVGYIMTVMAFIYALSQGLIAGPLNRKFRETTVIPAALFGTSVGFIMMIAAESFIAVLLSVSFFILMNSLLKPTSLSWISKHAGSSQGKAMGIAESSMSIGRTVGPLCAGLIFDVNIFAPFIVGSAVLAAASAAMLALRKPLTAEAWDTKD